MCHPRVRRGVLAVIGALIRRSGARWPRWVLVVRSTYLERDDRGPCFIDQLVRFQTRLGRRRVGDRAERDHQLRNLCFGLRPSVHLSQNGAAQETESPECGNRKLKTGDAVSCTNGFDDSLWPSRWLSPWKHALSSCRDLCRRGLVNMLSLISRSSSRFGSGVWMLVHVGSLGRRCEQRSLSRSVGEARKVSSKSPM